MEADFDKAVPPGGQGRIRVRVNTRGSEATMEKKAMVYSNDPSASNAFLSVRAYVMVPIRLSRRVVVLQADGRDQGGVVVEVTAGLDQALELRPGDFNLEGKVRYAIEEVEKGKRFQIRFQRLPGTTQAFQGYLKLQTNYQERPDLTIRIRGNASDGRG
ncbi:MAG: hypothetical protein JXL84_17910 [Deltaproteobacteria bacterium]|nr:hypothetical protein [Deltaproteobacteria bacterium]